MFWKKKNNFEEEFDFSYDNNKKSENNCQDLLFEQANNKFEIKNEYDDDSEEGKLLFEIKGKPLKCDEDNKIYDSNIKIYENCFEINLEDNEDTIFFEDILDIYIQEPIINDVTSRTTVIDYFDQGELEYYYLTDYVFPDLSKTMENLLKNRLTNFEDNYKYPKTIQWFIACSALNYIYNDLNYKIFGGANKTPKIAVNYRIDLYEKFHVNKKADFYSNLGNLYEGDNMDRFLEIVENIDEMDDDEIAIGERELVAHIQQKCGENGIWALDLQRLIVYCADGYISDYISYEDALDWCLKAGKRLQEKYSSWDEFMESFILGCSWREEEPLDDENTYAYMCQHVYAFYKNRNDNPWAIDWDTSLKKEW